MARSSREAVWQAGREGDAHRNMEQAGEVRSAQLESLRALAAVAVMTGHIFGQSRHYDFALTQDSYLHRLLLGGGYGVFLFFALSGYLLFWPFARHHFGSSGAIDLRRYAVNRVLRILPLYVVAVVVLMIVQEGGGTGEQWWRFLTFSENFSRSTIITVDGPMWSLVVEVHFYLLLPLLAWALAKVASRSKARAALVLVGLGAASYFAREHAIGGLPRRPLLELSLLATFMYFVPGMLLALLRLHWQERRPNWLRGPAASSDLWLLGAIAFVLIQFNDYGEFLPIALASFLAVGACVLPLRSGGLLRGLGWWPVAVIGAASYSLYIWHAPIVQRLATLPGIPHSFAAQFAIAGTVCLVVALISFRLIETPFLRLRGQWSPASARLAREPGPAVAPEPVSAPATTRIGPA